MEDAGELHADNTCTDDGKALGEGVELQQSCGIDDMRIRPGTFDGEPFRFGACGDDDMRGCIVANCMSIHKHTFFTNQRDVRMREDALYPTPQLRHHLSHTLTSLIEGGSMDIGLRGDAAYIQTGASHL